MTLYKNKVVLSIPFSFQSLTAILRNSLVTWYYMYIDTCIIYTYRLTLNQTHCETSKKKGNESVKSHSNPMWSWKVSIPRRLCRLLTDLLSSSSMLWIAEYDAWWCVCGVHRDRRDAADIGDTAGSVSWALQSTSTTCQDIKMDGRDLLCVLRMEHN